MEFGVLKLVNGMDRARVQSSILSTCPAGELQNLLARDVGLYQLARRPGNDVGLIWRMCRLFRSVRPDVVHTHGWGTLVEGLCAARLAGVPVVIHGEHGTLQLRPYQKRVQRWAWGAADRVLTVSSRLAERMSSETGFPLGRIQTIRNGVDLARFGRVERADARAALGLRPTEMVIGTVGRLVPVKNHRLLISASALLRTQGLEPVVLITGEGPARTDLENAASGVGIADRIRFLGHRTDPEVVMASMDVYVLTSISEGLPNTILEAMAIGLPIVTTRVGGVDELIEDGVTGYLVEPRNAAALAEGLSNLLRDETLRRRTGSAARERAESEFSLSAMIQRYEALYASTLPEADVEPHRH